MTRLPDQFADHLLGSIGSGRLAKHIWVVAERDCMPAVLITGAGRGFGRALLDVYAQRGWLTFPLVREKKTAVELEASLADKCYAIVADVTTEQASARIANALAQRSGSLDVLINNAGNIKRHRGLFNTSPDDLEDLFRVHCVGAFRCTKAAVPYLLRAKRPVVVNISSRWGSISYTSPENKDALYSYRIAKCAQNMLTVCLDQELRSMGIKVFAVHPGKLRTDMGSASAAVDPLDAASALADWVDHIGEQTVYGLYDLMEKQLIAW